MLQVALHVHLRLFAVGRGGKRDDAKDTRADALGDGFDGSALAGAVAAFEYENDAQALVLHPILELTELDLKLSELLCIPLRPHFPVLVRGGFFMVFHRTESTYDERVTSEE